MPVGNRRCRSAPSQIGHRGAPSHVHPSHGRDRCRRRGGVGLRRSSLLVRWYGPEATSSITRRPFEDHGMNELALVQKVWNYAHVSRDQGVRYQAYISQISHLLFLKMDDERAGLVAPGLVKGEARGLPLAGVARPAGRRVDAALFGDSRPAVALLRHRRHDFSESAERDPRRTSGVSSA